MTLLWNSRLAIALACTHFLSSAFAQEPVPSFTSSSDSTPVIATPSVTPAQPKVYTIKVGAGGFKFSPQQITNVAVGDVVSFEFYPPDHSVARADFDSPCVPYEYSGRNRQGFWSGTQLVTSTADIEHFNVTVNSTEPIFFYCAAPNSCLKELMVGVINPNSTQTLQAQIAAAKSASFQVAPGEPMPNEGDPTSTSTATSGPTSHERKMSTGMMVGIAVGILAFLALCAALFFFIGRSKSLKEVVKRHDEGAIMKPVGVGGGYQELGVQHHNTFPLSQVTGGPYSPSPAQTEFSTPLPTYAQLHGTHGGAAEQKYAAGSGVSGHGQQWYNDQKASQPAIAELHSPMPGQQFVAELEAPNAPVKR